MLVIMEYLSFGIGVVGISVITWGALISTVSCIKLTILQIKGNNTYKNREIVRHHFGSYILLGLEFLIAADIMETIIKPSLQEVAILGSIVVIRTILSFFLNRELEANTSNIPVKKQTKKAQQTILMFQRKDNYVAERYLLCMEKTRKKKEDNE